MKKLYFFLYIILVTYLSFLCFCITVNASIVTYPEAYFSFNRVDDFPYTVNNGSSYRMEYTFPETGQYPFLELLVCTEGEYNNFTIVSDACNTSCFEPGKVQYYVKNKCSINGNTNGYLVNLQIRVKKSEYLAVDGMFRTINQLTLNGTGKTRIEGYYGSDTDELSVLIADRENTENIIDNDNDNTQAIIDNQNDNTQAIIDNNTVCNEITSSTAFKIVGYIGSDGSLVNNSSFRATDFIPLTTLYISTAGIGSGIYTCFYGNNYELISCTANQNVLVGNYTLPIGTKYIRTSQYNNTPVFSAKTCKNGGQATTDAINDMNDNITNSNIDSPSGDFADMEDLIAHNGVITNLIALPITLYTSILNNVNSSCSDFNLGNLYNKNITFSCINLGNILGSTIWGVIDILFSGFTIYAISKKMIKVFQNFSGLQEGDVIDD